VKIMLSKEMYALTAGHASTDTRRFAAMVLRAASLALGRLARRLGHIGERRRGEPVFEFYAEAGAPEGALYVDGQLVGFVPGVKRL
jgi:hypothetical protein